MRFRVIVASAALLLACADARSAAPPSSDVHAILGRARRQIEDADYRATGRLVTIDSAGKRTNYTTTIKAHWFPGVLRALIDIVPPAGSAAKERIRILLEMHPNGTSTIRVAHPGDAGLVVLPFDKWDENLFGGAFSYEDFLESQYYWQDQTLLKPARFGARDCDVLKSMPGPSDRTHYADAQTWLDRTIAYPVYAEKTSKDKTTVKQFTYMGLRQSGSVWSASQVEAKIRGRAGSTLLLIERGTTKANLSLKDFSPDQIGRFEDRP
jgi:hypothetical protein